MSNTRRIWLGLLLSLCLLLATVPQVSAEPETQPEASVLEREQLTISSLEQFLSFAENCRLDTYSKNLAVDLVCDLDLTGTAFDHIPYFAGTFSGNGHTISGVQIGSSGSYQGFFRYLTSSAVIQDLRVEGTVIPAESRTVVGGIAGINWGLIRNCVFSGKVSGTDYVGGITGRNAVTGILENCTVEGMVNGFHFVGGFAGENQGVIRSCENLAQVNTTPEQNTVDFSDVTIEDLTDSESFGTATDIGGISGGNTGVIRDCVNRAVIGYRQMGYNIGGISGSQAGHISGCTNYGNVRGRKEVGGIVGHMEPATLIAFETDTLQTLEGQVDALAGLTQQMSYDARNSSTQLSSQMTALEGQIDSIQSAIGQLIPTPESPELPDLDSFLAAQSTLSSSLSAMGGTMEGLTSATKNAVGTLANDIQAISGQIGAIGGTLGASSENMGGSLSDVSDKDTPEDTTGKVENCINYGDIFADLNAGGISGAMALENDLDPEDDVELRGNTSLNFSGEMRVVVLNCENHGSITVNKRRVGGIVGWQPMGLIQSCVNAGDISSASADYVGGIAGQSGGFIRQCSVKSIISGDSYVGGIAGEGAILSDCRSMVKLEASGEKLGEVLGWTEDRAGVIQNCFLPIEIDHGGIDGISYSGSAEPMEAEAFFAQDGLQEMFRTVRVTFLFEDGTSEVLSIPTGGELKEEDIPDLPDKEGTTARWEGLEEAELSRIHFDLTFYPHYAPLNSVIQSELFRENGLPVLLAEGGYYSDEIIGLEVLGEVPAGLKGDFIEGWTVTLPDQGRDVTLHYLPFEEYSSEDLKLLVLDGAGVWRETDFIQEGSYLIFGFQPEEQGFCLLYAPGFEMWMVGAAAGGAIMIFGTIYLIHKSSKKYKTKQNI